MNEANQIAITILFSCSIVLIMLWVYWVTSPRKLALPRTSDVDHLISIAAGLTEYGVSMRLAAIMNTSRWELFYVEDTYYLMAKGTSNERIYVFGVGTSEILVHIGAHGFRFPKDHFLSDGFIELARQLQGRNHAKITK